MLLSYFEEVILYGIWFHFVRYFMFLFMSIYTVDNSRKRKTLCINDFMYNIESLEYGITFILFTKLKRTTESYIFFSRLCCCCCRWWYLLHFARVFWSGKWNEIVAAKASQQQRKHNIYTRNVCFVYILLDAIVYLISIFIHISYPLRIHIYWLRF